MINQSWKNQPSHREENFREIPISWLVENAKPQTNKKFYLFLYFCLSTSKKPTPTHNLHQSLFPSFKQHNPLPLQTYKPQPTVFDPYLTKYVRIALAPHTYSTKLISLSESARRRRRYFFHFCSPDVHFFPTQKRLVNYKRCCRG